jgi:hypothetical protein
LPLHVSVSFETIFRGLPSTTEPQREGNLKKTHQRTKRKADDFWRRWEREYLMELRSFHVISQPKGRSGKVRTGDIVLLQEDHRPRHVEEGPGRRAEGGDRQGHENGCTLWGKRNCSGLPDPAGQPPGGSWVSAPDVAAL